MSKTVGVVSARGQTQKQTNKKQVVYREGQAAPRGSI